MVVAAVYFMRVARSSICEFWERSTSKDRWPFRNDVWPVFNTNVRIYIRNSVSSIVRFGAQKGLLFCFQLPADESSAALFINTQPMNDVNTFCIPRMLGTAYQSFANLPLARVNLIILVGCPQILALARTYNTDRVEKKKKRKKERKRRQSFRKYWLLHACTL